MGVPSSEKLRQYFASKYLVADGGTLTQQTADGGGSASTIVDAALTEADDFWNGAIGYFDGATTTAALQGIFFHVKDFDAASDTLTLHNDLPAANVAGDTYHLILGGNWRSATELFGLTLDGDLPELKTVSGTNVTGLTLKKASGKLGVGTLSVFYDFSLDLLHIKMDAGDFGVGLDVSGDVSDEVIFLPDGFGWLQVDVTAASLPGSDQTDTFTTAKPERTLTPDYEGVETGADGITRYILEVVKNTDGSDLMQNVGAYCSKAVGTVSAVKAGQSLAVTEDDAEMDDASTWPTQGFWIRNTTVNGGAGDCRYVKHRSGNTVFCQGVVWGTLGYDAGANEIFAGDIIEDAVTGATAIVDQITLASGTWAGNDAAGTITFKKIAGGTFDNDNNIEVSSVVMAVADGGSVLGMRGLAAVAWSAADVVEIMPDFDIGLDAPSTLQFENPSAVLTAPDGVTFSAPITEALALAIGDLAVSGIYGFWRRSWIVAGARARDDLDHEIEYFWT